VTARMLGDLVLAFHFVFTVFAVLGGFLVLWKSWIVWLHIPSVLWSAFVNLFYQVCPLTPLENRFRYRARQAGYEGGFIQHYLAPLVYPGGMPERWGLVAGYSVLAWNALLYALVVSLRRRGS
jgi:hypothetical protein